MWPNALLFTALATIGGGTGLGYRVVAAVSGGLAALGGVLMCFFNEKRIEAGLGEGK